MSNPSKSVSNFGGGAIKNSVSFRFNRMSPRRIINRSFRSSAATKNLLSGYIKPISTKLFLVSLEPLGKRDLSKQYTALCECYDVGGLGSFKPP